MYNDMSVRIPGRALYFSVFSTNSLLSTSCMFIVLCTLVAIQQGHRLLDKILPLRNLGLLWRRGVILQSFLRPAGPAWIICSVL